MELIQWLIILALGGVVVFLWRERRENRVPSWLRDLQQDDWITRAELDQYHLQIIQMSQAQRELMNARFDELNKPPLVPDMDNEAPMAPPVSLVDPVPALSEPVPTISEPVIEETSGRVCPEELEVDPPPPVCGAGTLGMDAPSRAISLFREGKTIEQIAQELRIGRQETQLLIRMAQHKPSSFAGV